MKYFKLQEIKEVRPESNILIDIHNRVYPLNECQTSTINGIFDVEELMILSEAEYIEDLQNTEI